jgi:CRP-like cAMP-binding protein
MIEDREQALQFIRKLPFFGGLPEGDLDALMHASLVKDYPRHTPLFHQGDKANRFFVILSGWIKLHRETIEGEEAVVALFTRGDVFGEAALFGGSGYPFSAEAVEDTRILEIPAQIMKDMAKQNAELMNCVIQSMSREMHKLQVEKEHMAIMSAPQRVGCLLLQLSTGMIGKGGTFPFPYDKSLAAARLGMKPETFSRALVQLQPLGVVAKGTEIKISSFTDLIDFCCSHCSEEAGACGGSRRESCESTTCPGKKAKATGN